MAALRHLRAQAGDPSFRRMAAKSGAVSHATLHLTVTGFRLQPWETVREFVRACDGDEDAWHARWQETYRALSAGHASDPPAGDDHDPAPGVSAPKARAWLRSPRLAVPLAVAVAAVIGTVAAVRTGADGDAGHGAVRSADPDAMVYEGDASRFLRDVTYPDGTVVKPGTQFVKIWEVRNSGSVEWRNRYLQRIDLPIGPDDCSTPERIPVNRTLPKQNVQITVTVRTPSKAPVDCKVRWKMVDTSGRKLMPDTARSSSTCAYAGIRRDPVCRSPVRAVVSGDGEPVE